VRHCRSWYVWVIVQRSRREIAPCSCEVAKLTNRKGSFAMFSCGTLRCAFSL
jgi:hypothetical protein